MVNEKKIRFLVVITAVGLHLLLLFFFAFDIKAAIIQAVESPRVMKVTDLAEDLPPPLPSALPPAPSLPLVPPAALFPPRPPPPASDVPVVEAIAENMVATETPPLQTVGPPGSGSIGVTGPVGIGPARPTEEYLPAHKISEIPQFNQDELAKAVVYPEMAKRSGIEGRVILELFVDRTGTVRQVRILQEVPEGRGFGEAAVKAFTGLKGSPARANGEPVSARYRYPVMFRLK